MKPSSIAHRVFTAVITSGWFLVVYNFTNWITSMRSDISSAAFSWEARIPFVPIFIIPYWSIDLFFMAAPFLLKSQNDLNVYRRRILLTISTAGVFFLLFPLNLQFVRPNVDGFLGILFGFLDNFNNFWNLAPSLHIALRTILWTVYVPLCAGFSRNVLRLWFICVGASTLLCWQHHIIDVFTGQLLGLFVIQIIHPYSFDNREGPTRRHIQLALRYGGATVTWIVLTVLFWPEGVLLLWPALSFLLVALAYLRSDPRILGKFSRQLTQSAWWMLLPYRILAKAWQKKYLSRELVISRISPELIIGAMPTPIQAKSITASGILDLTAEYPGATGFVGENYRNVPMLDLVAPSCQQLTQAVRGIEELSRNGEVYMHCALGLGRSATVAAAWLLYAKYKTNLDSAIATVVECCEGAVINEADRQSLNDFIKWMHDGRTESSPTTA